MSARSCGAPSPPTSRRLLAAGDLELDRETHRVRRDGKELHLGPTEFKLLEFLMQSPGRVFSREQLLDSVWGHDVYIDERTVDVHVGRLRKALNLPPQPDPIRTVRGAGYSFDETFARGAKRQPLSTDRHRRMHRAGLALPPQTRERASLALAIGDRLIGNAGMMSAIRQPGDRSGPAEAEFRPSSDRPWASGTWIRAAP